MTGLLTKEQAREIARSSNFDAELMASGNDIPNLSESDKSLKKFGNCALPTSLRRKPPRNQLSPNFSRPRKSCWKTLTQGFALLRVYSPPSAR